MFYSALINKAIDLAYEAHHWQKDKAIMTAYAG